MKSKMANSQLSTTKPKKNKNKNKNELSKQLEQEHTKAHHHYITRDETEGENLRSSKG